MKSEPRTFIDIFSVEMDAGKTVESIEIPIIQRDYAQGRLSKQVTRIRNGFVNSLYNAVTGDETDAIKLDFVYGTIEDDKLIPLDGQQRLTTLFLLHWYIGKKEEVSPDELSFLKNFLYRTRFSSQYFCQSLVDSEPDFSLDKISTWIKDQNWFMYSWENDPTISSMLVMIDEIHARFRNENNLWDGLTNKDYQPVSFYFLALEEMGLSDSLYVKMNSRGKALTMFEHFKADFEKILKGVDEGLHDEFSKKVDGEWQDMFWHYRGLDNLIDDEFMRYYRFVTETICYINEIEILDNDFDLAHKVYGIENPKAKANIKNLIDSLDCLVSQGNLKDFFNSIFSNTNYQQNKVVLFSENVNLFELCCDFYGEISGNRRLFSFINTFLLFGAIEYLKNKEHISIEQFRERIRIIRNLALNSQFEIRRERMPNLLSDTFEIIRTGNVPLKSGGFNETQKEEEINKQSWRENNTELVEYLNELEDHYLLQGQIAIIGLEYPELFTNRVQKFLKLFNGGIDYIKISNALLSIGDYSQLEKWRFLFGNKKDSSWSELFKVSQQRKNFERTKEILHVLLDEINGDFEEYSINRVKNYLLDGETKKDWRYYFLKYPTMRMGQSGVYCWLNDPDRVKTYQYEVIMMNTPLSLNGRHWDPFLYSLSKDEALQNELILSEYGGALYFKDLYVVLTNDTISFYSERPNKFYEVEPDAELIESIEIPQENGVDIVDRIELLKQVIINKNKSDE